MPTYDIAIVGGGPAGLTSGIYGARAKLKTIIFEKAIPGGQAFTTRELVNYPGFFGETSGPYISKKIQDHAIKFGAEFVKEEVIDININLDPKVITTNKGNEYHTKAVILAPGAEPRLLNVKGEKEFKGNGVSYCATCDAEFYEGQTVIVIGNGDAAIEEAIYLTKFADKVIIVVIHDEGVVDCNKYSAEKAFNNHKIDFVWNSILDEIKGNDEVSSVIIKNLKNDSLSEIKCEGVFIYIGSLPRTGFLKAQVEMDERGYIVTNEKMGTSVPGVFAVGDARNKYLRQVVTAVNDGAIAAVAAERYIFEEDEFKERILESPKQVIIAFWSPFIPESINRVALLEKVVSTTDGRFRLVKIDTSRNQRIASKFKILNVPAIYLLNQEGQKIYDLTDKIYQKDLKSVLGI
ncbi:MAG: pyridine nucleotide-disulfide oxidoreductase [Peptococcaceae bacterium BICA1-8]|nr:MAG: pyridine nucleotide-disulfide oxidoreductase [Peptococcaceae bacterium BICA1-8]